MVKQYRMYIEGEWVEANSGETFTSTNPYTGQVWAEFPAADEADVDHAVRAARNAFENVWGQMLPSNRARIMRQIATTIAEHAEYLAQIETQDNGKLIREMAGQTKYLVDYYHYFAGAADKIHGEVIPTEKPTMFNYTLREPVGVVGAIVPWNSPLLLLSWKLAPALAAGCTMVVKPAEQTSASTLEFARLVLQATDLPPGVFNVVTGYGPSAGGALAKHPDVDKLAFTGSSETGKLVAHAAAENHTRLSLELGGKSPNIVFEDANLDNAVNGIMKGIFAATGQTCMAGSRLLVHDSVMEELLDKLAHRAGQIKLGDPQNMDTEMGPVAFKEQLDKIKYYCQQGVEEGAKVVVGGKPPERADLTQGYFFEPTIFRDVHNQMQIAREEIFGPVLCVIPFSAEAEAIQIANDTAYGLGAGIWTSNVQRAHRLAKAIKAGTVWVNNYRVVSYASPFGGFKASGYGRENGLEAIRDYTQVKSVWIELSDRVGDPFTLG
ncbi:MAG: aldehyde dehydrogenase [Anaerolineaceae bacterium]|nr:aldehyde dehydrogenase [Anaerolineaceae bacterium]